MKNIKQILVPSFVLFFVFTFSVAIAQETEPTVDAEIPTEAVAEEETPTEAVVEEETPIEAVIEETPTEAVAEEETTDEVPAEEDPVEEEPVAEAVGNLANFATQLMVTPTEEEKPSAEVIAHKVVCDDESYLPNWGEDGPDITSTTAKDYVANSDGHCSFEEGWEFEWAKGRPGNPGDTLVGPAGDPWITFGPTDSNGMASTTIETEGGLFYFREVLKDGYIPFTYNPEGKKNTNDVSAEFYCNDDVKNYDNYDWIKNPNEDETYYCVGFNVEEEKPSAEVIAHKVVCDDESYLPNWGEGGPDITSTTAKDYVANSGGHCSFEEGWEFEWAPDGSEDPGDTLVGPAGGSWTTFGPTDSNGKTSITFDPTDKKVWFREVLQDGYLPFSKDASGDEVFDDVSAEFYCHDDAFKYDNREWINGLEDGGTYDCVAFNVEEEPQHVCKIGEEMIENGGFEKPVIDDKWASLPNGTTGFDWLVDWVTPLATPATAFFEIQKNYKGWLPYEGNQYAELDTNGEDNKKASVSLTQELGTVPGEDYTISFAFSPRPNTGTKDNVLEVYWGGTLIDTLTEDGSLNSNTVWGTHTYTVPATSWFTEFTLADGGTPNTLGTFVDDVSVVCGAEEEPDEDPYGAITYPVTDYDVESGLITLLAEYYDGDSDNDDIVQWAVREGACDPNTNTVAGNVDGFSDSFTWDGQDFSAPLDTDLLTPGDYCFVFNPEDDGSVDVRKTRWFTVLEKGDPDPTYQCSDGIDNDQDGYIDYPDDPGCKSETDDDETDDSEENSGGGSISGGYYRPSDGEVLGAFSGDTCGVYLNDYMREGQTDNLGEVIKLQIFLLLRGYDVPIDGIFGPETDAAVRKFQESFSDSILVPWVSYGFGDGKTPTGYVYKTTRYTINNIVCPGSEAYPQLP